MNSRSAAAGLAIAAMSVGLAACGSSKSDDDGGLSRKDISAQANAICKKAITASQAVTAPTSFEDAKVAAAYFDKIAPITEIETTALLALKPGDEVKSDYAAFTKAQTEANALLQTIKQKADSQDRSGLDDLKKVQPAGDAVSVAAKKVGATDCG
jgi:hypothetical protein